MELRDFSKSNFDMRMIKTLQPNAESFTTFSAYSERFLHYFGIRDPKVLSLLQKAQSAKNMGDINQFFREFMLEEPGTYEQAETLVENFQKLRSAYEQVKTARQQVEVLSKARAADDLRLKAIETQNHCTLLIDNVPAWQSHQSQRILQERIPELERKAETFRMTIEKEEKKKAAAQEELAQLKIDEYRTGGQQIERLEIEKKQLENRIEEMTGQIRKIRPYFDRLQIKPPASMKAWTEMKASFAERTEALSEEKSKLQDDRNEKYFTQREKEALFKQLTTEIRAMEEQPSNIPLKFLEVRNDLAESLDLNPEDLPFVGELIQIREEEAQWQGAAERVLHGFALSMLVSDQNYASLARLVDGKHLGIKLVYHRVQSVRESPREVRDNSLALKFDIRPGLWRRWILSELCRSFDYACVESTAQFASYERAVTLHGQIKHNQTRHEKDDRHNINDRRYWVTGFDNLAKRREFEAQARDLGQAIAALQKAVVEIEKKLRTISDLEQALNRLSECDWKDFDRSQELSRLTDVKKELEALNQGELRDLKNKIRQKEDEIASIEDTLKSKNYNAGKNKEELDHCLELFEKTRLDLEARQPDGAVLDTISRQAVLERVNLTLDNLSNYANRLTGHFKDEHSAAQLTETKKTGEMETQFLQFKNLWPTVSAEWTADLPGAPEFFQFLSNLEADGLPRFVERFLDLLENDAKQNLIHLLKEIDGEKRSIKSRMEEVNEGLSQAIFNKIGDKPTHLIIEVKDRGLKEYQEFKRMQDEIMRQLPAGKTIEQAESYYAKLEQLVDRLDAQKEDNRLWRDRVLDVRQHVQFQGREVDQENNVIDVYDSGSGKSGGQRQKLTMTCLVAALRYQLGGNSEKLPVYAPVLLDEAFDKADSDFTDISMCIFRDFGFQPVIATPLKGIYTLEPYIGSFSYVSCRERRQSSVMSITPQEIREVLHNNGEAPVP